MTFNILNQKFWCWAYFISLFLNLSNFIEIHFFLFEIHFVKYLVLFLISRLVWIKLFNDIIFCIQKFWWNIGYWAFFIRGYRYFSTSIVFWGFSRATQFEIVLWGCSKQIIIVQNCCGTLISWQSTKGLIVVRNKVTLLFPNQLIQRKFIIFRIDSFHYWLPHFQLIFFVLIVQRNLLDHIFIMERIWSWWLW